MIDGDIKFIYTFPNEFSFPGFVKLEGWQLFGELNLFIKNKPIQTSLP